MLHEQVVESDGRQEGQVAAALGGIDFGKVQLGIIRAQAVETVEGGLDQAGQAEIHQGRDDDQGVALFDLLKDDVHIVVVDVAALQAVAALVAGEALVDVHGVQVGRDYGLARGLRRFDEMLGQIAAVAVGPVSTL